MKNLIYLFIPLLLTQPTWAQQLEEDDIVSVEGLYKNQPAQQPDNKNAQLPEQLNAAPKQDVEVEDLKDLNRLAPFSEVSVIQKKYLPKTQRFQLYVGGGVMTNTPWYNNAGLKANLAYNFTETLGLEVATSFLTSSERETAKEIKDKNGLIAEQFIYTKNYYGLHLVWTPYYGKITSFDDSIIPFDMYFSIGGGSSTTNSQEENNSTFHAGVGQIFAITKSFAFRWDYSFNTFAATPVATSTLSNPTENRYNDLLLTLGVSFFFPEATYR